MSVVGLYHGGDGGGAVTVEARAHRPNQAGACPRSTFLIRQVRAFAKSSAARSRDGILPNLKDDADAYHNKRAAARAAAGASASSARGGFEYRWPPKWAAYRATCRVARGCRRVALVLSASGVQAEVGEIRCSVIGELNAGGPSAEPTPKRAKTEGDAATMHRWLSAPAADDGALAAARAAHEAHAAAAASAATAAAAERLAADGIFAEVPFDDATAAALARLCERQQRRRAQPQAGDDSQDAAEAAMLEAAIAESARAHAPQGGGDSHEDAEAAMIEAALAESARAHTTAAERELEEERQLAAAIAASLHGGDPPRQQHERGAPRRGAPVIDLTSDDDGDGGGREPQRAAAPTSGACEGTTAAAPADAEPTLEEVRLRRLRKFEQQSA